MHKAHSKPDHKSTAEHVSVPDPEVTAYPSKRRFTAQYKLRILQQADNCTEPGELGVLLRRECLYSSHLSRWRKQREQGILQALDEQKRGPKPHPDEQLRQELLALRRQNQQLQQRLEKAEAIIEIQKKVSALLGLELQETNPNRAW